LAGSISLFSGGRLHPAQATELDLKIIADQQAWDRTPDKYVRRVAERKAEAAKYTLILRGATQTRLIEVDDLSFGFVVEKKAAGSDSNRRRPAGKSAVDCK
jgi:hypothetical protein